MQENIKVIKFLFETVQSKIDFLIEIFSCFFSGWADSEIKQISNGVVARKRRGSSARTYVH